MMSTVASMAPTAPEWMSKEQSTGTSIMAVEVWKTGKDLLLSDNSYLHIALNMVALV